MSCIQSEAPSNAPRAGVIETYHVVHGFPHEEVRKANKVHKVFTQRDEIELCAEFYE